MSEEKRKDCCGTCMYFNGEPGDGTQFCDEREFEVHESGYCYRYIFLDKTEE